MRARQQPCREDSPLAEDVAELVTQSRRCREILKSLGRADCEALRPFTRVPLSALLTTIAESHRPPGNCSSMSPSSAWRGELPEPQLIPRRNSSMRFANLIDNALKFARQQVRIVVRLDADVVAVGIEDDGPGFSPEVLELLGEPYISTSAAQRWTWPWRVHRGNTACANRRDAAICQPPAGRARHCPMAARCFGGARAGEVT